jgi:hypothetical protein
MSGIGNWVWLILLFPAISPAAVEGPGVIKPDKPLFREFMGLNGHTIQFKPELYAPVCRAVRDYHPMEWDTGADTSFMPPFPLARNGVDWEKVYGAWKASGYETDVCIMFNDRPAKAWKDLARDPAAYGRAFAKAFGPSSSRKLVKSVEVGNEPGEYDDESYRTVFKNMAHGLREGDPKLKIGTCALTTGKSEKYAKSVACIQGLEGLCDFLNIHTYAELEGYPTWRRSYPEDPKLDYLRRVERLIAWRDQHAPGKEVRITEFGWDASTKPAPTTGTFSKWVGSSEQEQAQYLVRSFLVFSKYDVARAYIFFFDDKDEPQIHGSSGLTRNGRPKPAFYAVAHLRRTLGDYRFHRVLRETQDNGFVYEFIHGDNPKRRIWAVWSATGSGQRRPIQLKTEGMKLVEVTRMPLTEKEAPKEHPFFLAETVTVECTESPLFLEWITDSRTD